MNKKQTKKPVKEKSWKRWIEVSDYSLVPRQHGEYSNSESGIFGQAIEVIITPVKK